MNGSAAADKGPCSLILKHEPDGTFSVSVGASAYNSGTAVNVEAAANLRAAAN